MDIISRLAEELNIRKGQAEAAVTLLDEGNTVPFIARYRKDVTDSLNDEQLRTLSERLEYLRSLEQRKEQVIMSITEQGKMTPQLHRQIEEAQTLVAVEDLYLPYRPKRRTRASIARERGLEGLAKQILTDRLLTDLYGAASAYVDPEKEVLNLLRQNARLTVEDIAAMTKRSAAEVQSIIKKLEDDGVILKYAAIVNPEKDKEAQENVKKVSGGMSKVASVDMKKTVSRVMKEVERGKSVPEIASRLGLDEELAEQICRLYLTHPGVTADQILTKMGL